MNTKKTTKTNNIMDLALTGDFDQVFKQDRKEMDEKVKYHNNRKGKEVQLLAKISQIQMSISKTQTEYLRSLVDPTKDSVALAIELQTLAKEQEIAEQVFKQLFPKSKMLTAAK